MNEQYAFPPQYYNAAAPVEESNPAKPLKLPETQECLMNELMFSLFGAILTLIPLPFLRDMTTSEMLPLNILFFTILILGMSMAVKGFLLQQTTLKMSKTVGLYAQKTYDSSFDVLSTGVSRNDRKALLLTFFMSLFIGTAQVVAQLYIVGTYLLEVIGQWL